MTLREKIIELMQFHCVNGWTRKDEYPSMDIYVPLKHNVCFGATNLNIIMNNGLPTVNDIPQVYNDIYDQEIVSENKVKNFEETYVIHLELPKEYLDAKAKELSDKIPNAETMKEEFHKRIWDKVHDSLVYKQADAQEREYLETQINNAFSQKVLNEGTPEELMTTYKVFFSYVGNALEAYHNKYLGIGKTNYEIIMKKSLEELADFFVSNFKEIEQHKNSLQGMEFYLKEVQE